MEAATQTRRGTVLFVDDERRVLTSMRAMFRRDYEVLLANSGAEALDLLRDQAVDVIVSDQRMPGMTGVEVLKQVKELAPGSMRILLTGYADLKAIEASINEGEVFRYLTKPCPSDELKRAVGLAAEAARHGRGAGEDVEEVEEIVAMEPLPEAPSPAPQAPQSLHAARAEAPDEEHELIELWPIEPEPKRAARTTSPVDLSQRAPRAEPQPPKASDAPKPAKAKPSPEHETVPIRLRPRSASPKRAARRANEIRDVDLLALTTDQVMVDMLEQALDGSHRLHVATDLDSAVVALEKHAIGVLVTDMAVSQDEITHLTTLLKQHVPELITIVASDRSDAQVLIDLINFGQIFRFLLKPLHAGQCRLSIESAVSRHRELAADPTLVRRHVVAARGANEGVVHQVLDRVRRLRERFFTANGVA